VFEKSSLALYRDMNCSCSKDCKWNIVLGRNEGSGIAWLLAGV